jgi:tRNA(Arg) A34 adenosine deaminase TadA
MNQEQIANTLRSLLPKDLKLSKIRSSPALVTDSKGEIVSFAYGICLPYETPTVRALRLAAAKEGLADLSGKGHKLHVIGDLQGQIESMGAINNFAPSMVEVFSSPDFAVKYNPSSTAYFPDLQTKRSVLFNTRSLSEFDINAGSDLDISLATFAGSKDPHITELQRAYINLEILYSSNHFNTDHNSELYRELMQSLHQLALKNVELDGGPFAAAVISAEGNLISVGSNRVFPLSDPLLHGEVCAISRAYEKVDSLAGATLVTSAQTCIGCAETTARTGIKTIIYGNTASEIEENTCFSEGPLDPNFFQSVRIQEIAMPKASDLRAFEAFTASTKRYLVKAT